MPSWLPATALLTFASAWFALRCHNGLHFGGFGDESGHLVGARAIAAGDRLYRDFIDAHGPLSFMVAHAYGTVFGWREPLAARWVTIAFMIVAATAIATSTALQNAVARQWAAAIFLGGIAAPWIVESLQMLNYHALGGAMVAVALAWLIVPAWTGARLIRWQALCSGFCLAMACGAAYSLAPTALFFGASAVLSVRSRDDGDKGYPALLACAAGFLSGCLVLLLWLLWFGDVVGYFVFHVIQQQVNYSRYTNYGIGVLASALEPSLAPILVTRTVSVITGLLGFVLLALTNKANVSRDHLAKHWLAFTACLLGVLMLEFRGAAGFQQGSFLVASVALVALSLPMRLAALPSLPKFLPALAGSIVIGLLLSSAEIADRTALNSPFGYDRQTLVKQPKTSLKVDRVSPLTRRIQAVLHPGERLAVLVYNPALFLTSGFLPIRQFHEYLPWEADYARAPWFGRTRDLCATLMHNPPPVIVDDNWKVWGMYSPESFMPCLQPLLASTYVADAVPTLFIRKDRVPEKPPMQVP